MNGTEKSYRGLRVIGLLRTSTDDQTEFSIPQQLELLKKWAKEQEMIWVDHVAVEGVSGSMPGNRSDLESLKQRKLEKNDFDLILVQSRHRWTRAGQEHGSWLKGEFGRIGVRIVSVTSTVGPNDRYAWLVEGLDDESSNSYVRSMSHDQCRSRQKKMEDRQLAYCLTPPSGIDRIYVNADGQELYRIRNLRDGTQQRIELKTGDILETYPKRLKGEASRHFRKHKTDTVLLVPGYEEALEAIRYAMHQHYVVGWGYHRIAEGLNGIGILSPNATRWGQPSVEQILHGTIYTGTGTANMWQSGKFYVRDRDRPRELKYDPTALLERKYPKRVLRDPKEWVSVPYPSLSAIIQDDALRGSIYEQQIQHWKARQAGALTPRRDKHALSKYVLKHILRCSVTGKSLCGKRGTRNFRYYVVGDGNAYPDKSCRIGRNVPADPLEQAAVAMLQEALRPCPQLDEMIREIVEREVQASKTLDIEVVEIQKQLKKVQAQIAFAIHNLDEMGEEGTKQIVGPLKQKKFSLEARLAVLREREKGFDGDVDTTVVEIRSSLVGLSGSLQKMSPLPLRQVLAKFMKMTINMATLEVDVEISLPEWAIRHAERIKMAVVVDPPQYQTERVDATQESGMRLAKFRCTFQRHVRQRSTCHYQRLTLPPEKAA